jgi:hypothetical protein
MVEENCCAENNIHQALVLMLAILPTWEAEMGKIVAQSQPGQVVLETVSPKTTRAKWAAGVTHVEAALQVRRPDFKPQSHQKQNNQCGEEAGLRGGDCRLVLHVLFAHSKLGHLEFILANRTNTILSYIYPYSTY